MTTTRARKPGPKGELARATHDELLTVDEVCTELGINRHTFYKYRKRYATFRTLPVGGRTYMRKETLSGFLKSLEAQHA